MKYILNQDNLLPQITKKLSEVAARAYSAEGVALYDAIVPIERDNEVLYAYSIEAIKTLADRIGRDAVIAKTNKLQWQVMWNAAEHGSGMVEFEDLSGMLIRDGIITGYTQQQLTDWMYADLTYIYLPDTYTEEDIHSIEEYIGQYGFAIIYEAIPTEELYDCIDINISTFDDRRETTALGAIEQFIVYTAIAKYLEEKYPEGGELYAKRAITALDEVVRYMYQRLKPAMQ